jgi:predicted lipoprotein with Yx(FWY)xxD motif
MVACSSNKDGGIVLPEDETGGRASGGTSEGSGGSPTASGGTDNPGMDAGGSGGEPPAVDPGGAGSSAGGAASDGGTTGGGAGGTLDNGAGAGALPGELCVFHTEAPEPSGEPEPEPEASAGAGGAAPQYDVSLKVSPFVGPYLADREGKSLYIYGADFPGDCETPPVSNCFDDCLMAWPLFDAGPRDLQEGLDDDVFGQIEREDGAFQSTFYGWPLYYFRDDLAAGQLNGQGRGRIWFAAETVLPNVMILRAPEDAGGIRYLGDERGRSLYVFADDVPGTAASPPVSHCSGDCLEDFAVFTRPAVLPVSSLEPADLSVFFREDGAPQIAYRGQPLYTSAADTRSGEMNGTATDGWSLIIL